MILLCYDGSADAQSAIDRAGELFSGQQATVLTVWEGLLQMLARGGMSLGIGVVDFEEVDASNKHDAEDRAAEGVKRAQQAGLTAQPLVVERGVTIWETILQQANQLDASAIVLGSRGLTGVKSLLLGSVSHAVLQHADRSVVVVPSPDVAARRAAELR